MSNVAIGIDIGTRNLPCCLYDEKTKRAYIIHTDLLNRQGKIIKPNDANLVDLLTEYVEENDHIFSKVKLFGIEEQKSSNWKGEKKGVRVKGYTKKTFAYMQHILHALLKVKYPKAEVFIVNPRSVRSAFGTSVKQTKDLAADYKKRKQKSVNIKLMPPSDVDKCKKVFRRYKNKPAKLDDVYDSIMLAIYTVRYTNKLRVKANTEYQTDTSCTSQRALSTSVNIII